MGWFCSECWEHQMAFFPSVVLLLCMQDLRFFKLSSFSFRNQTIISWLVVKNNCIPLSYSLLAFLISGVFAEMYWLRRRHLRWPKPPLIHCRTENYNFLGHKGTPLSLEASSKFWFTVDPLWLSLNSLFISPCINFLSDTEKVEFAVVSENHH